MVLKCNIECECGQLFSLFPQMDNTLREFRWPLTIQCPSCRSILRLHMDINGVIEKEYLSDDQDTIGLIYSCSSIFPIPKTLYLKSDMGMGLHSAFMMMLVTGFSQQDVIKHSSHVCRLHFAVYEHRKCFTQLLPILFSSNYDAFTKKFKKIFGREDAEMVLKNQNHCKGVFDSLIEQSFRTLITDDYANNACADTFKPILEYLMHAPVEDIMVLYNSAKFNHNYTDWERHEAYPFIADFIANIESYYPSMIYAAIGQHNDMNHDNVAITTIDQPTVIDMYCRGYEVASHALTLLVAVANTVFFGNHDKFPGAENEWTLADFDKRQTAQQFKLLASYPQLSKLLGVCFNNHIRNSKPHEGVRYESTTQLVTCLYDEKDPSKHDDYYLIDIASQVYMMAIHIIEIQTILGVIRFRIKK